MARKPRAPDRRSKRYRLAREDYEYEYQFWMLAEIDIEQGHDPPVLIHSRGEFGVPRRRYRTEEIIEPFRPRIRSAAVVRELELELADTFAWLRQVARTKMAAARDGHSVEVGPRPLHRELRSVIDDILQCGPGFADLILHRSVTPDDRRRLLDLHSRFRRETGNATYELPEREKDPDAAREKKRNELGERARSDVRHATACALALLFDAGRLEGDDFWWGNMRNDAACSQIVSDSIDRAQTWLRITRRLRGLALT